jgi:hypothetical protein
VVTPLERDHFLDAESIRAVMGDDAEISGKQMVPARSVGQSATRLVAFVDLAFVEAGEPRIRRIAGLEALAALVPQAVRFILDEPERHSRELDALAGLVDTVAMFRLERPRGLERLSATTNLIVSLLQTEVADGCCHA